MIEHTDRAHALLSASGAERWLACNKSARLEEQFEDTDSEYAKEGTLAHELAEIMLRKAVGRIAPELKISPKDFKTALAKIESSDLYTQDMPGHVEVYVDYVMLQFKAAKKRTKGVAVLLIEDRLDFSKYVPEGFGTGDAEILSDDFIEVIDLKYGKGIRVEAEKNDQLGLYGIGAYVNNELLYNIENIRLSIVQPRLDHISVSEVSVKKLLNWADKTVRPAAVLAYEGKGSFVAGDHCRWCLAKARCTKMAEYANKIAAYEFAAPSLLEEEDLLKAYAVFPVLQDWIKSVSDYVFKEALNGKDWNGYKLVQGRSNRVWKDVEAFKELLSKTFTEDQYLNSKIKGIGDIEKLLGKSQFKEEAGPFLHKPPGTPTLVPESDKRAALSSEDSAVKDFT